MNDTFQTVSSAKKNITVMLITWAALSVAALLGLLVSVAVCVFIEAILLFTCLFMLLLVSKTKWMLDFQGPALTITNMANHQQYRFESLRTGDFVFSQTDSQKGKNCGHLKIQGSSAVFHDVQRFDELKSYVSAHFE